MGVELEAKVHVPSLVSQTHWTEFSSLEMDSWLRVECGKEWLSLYKKGQGRGLPQRLSVALGGYRTSLGLGFLILKVGMTIAPLPAILKIRWHHVSTVPGTEPGRGGSSMNKLSEQEPVLPMSMLSSSAPIPAPESFPVGSQCSNPLAAVQSRRPHLWRVCEQSHVQENNQIPIKPNYFHCLLIAMLLCLSPATN